MATLTMNARLRQTEGAPEELDMTCEKSTTAHLGAWDFHLLTLERKRAAALHDAPDPIDPGPDDYQPTPEEIEANAGPTLVNICRDSECWDVVATANSPQWSEVA